MVTVSRNSIMMTRGDTLKVQVGISIDGEPYTPDTNDVVRFAVKHQTMNAAKTEYTDSDPLILKTIPNDTLLLVLEPGDTKSLGFGTYDFDIQITFADGVVDTFISGTLKLTKEVE